VKAAFCAATARGGKVAALRAAISPAGRNGSIKASSGFYAALCRPEPQKAKL